NVTLGPVLGAVNVTTRPTRGLPFAPSTRADSLCLKAVLITADCGVPPVAEIVGPVAAIAAATGTSASAAATAAPLREIDVSFTSVPLPRMRKPVQYQGALPGWEEGWGPAPHPCTHRPDGRYSA